MVRFKSGPELPGLSGYIFVQPDCPWAGLTSDKKFRTDFNRQKNLIEAILLYLLPLWMRSGMQFRSHQETGAVSSAGSERVPHTYEVTGSNPVQPTPMQRPPSLHFFIPDPQSLFMPVFPALETINGNFEWKIVRKYFVD